MSRSENQITTVNISTLSFVKVLIIIGVVGFLFLIRDILAILFVSLIFASALSPLVGAFERKGIPRALGILFIYLSMIGIFSFAIILLIPPIVQEYTQLAQNFPNYTDRVIQMINEFAPQVNVIDQLKNVFRSFQSELVQTAGGIFTKIIDVVQGFFAFIILFVVTFYMIIEENVIRKAVHMVTPVRMQPYIDELTGKIQKKIGLWLRAQMILCFIIFLLSFVGLSLLGVNYALILALVAGLTEFIPIIGPIVGSLPAIFIAFNQSHLLAVWVILLYLLIQRLENDFLVPRVMQKTVGINPLISIIALLIGAKIGGLLGMLLAIPVATVITVILTDFFGHDEDLKPELQKETAS